MKLFASCRVRSFASPTFRRKVASRSDGVELDVVQHLGHGVAVHQVGDLVALLGQPDVHGVGVAEQVVQVAQDLLVGAGQEDAEDVGLALANGCSSSDGLPFRPPANRSITPSESQVMSCSVPRRVGCSSSR